MKRIITESSNEKIIGQIKAVSFFKMFANQPDVLNKIIDICTPKNFSKGKKIIKEDEFGDTIYIILKGEIKITKKTLQRDEYTVTTLNADMGGVYVGELALIDKDTRSATVIAKTDCECLEINRQNFLRFGDENPRLGLEITRAIARLISSKLRKANTDVVTLFSALVEELDEKD